MIELTDLVHEICLITGGFIALLQHTGLPNTDVNELDYEIEHSQYRSMKEDSIEPTDHWKRVFLILMSICYATFGMIQDGRNEQLIYSNTLAEQRRAVAKT